MLDAFGLGVAVLGAVQLAGPRPGVAGLPAMAEHGVGFGEVVWILASR